MIQINVMQEGGTFMSGGRAESTSRKSSKQAGLAVVLVVLIAVVGSLGYFLYAGVPVAVSPYVPEIVLTSLNLTVEPSAQTAVQTQTALVTPGATQPDVKPVNPSDDAVEEVVKTMRPDVFYNKERKEYRQLLPSEKILHQKMMMAAAFATFRSVTPATFGFTDLVFKIPDYYYTRGMGSDDKSLKAFQDSLRNRSVEFTLVPPPDGKKTLEFTAYGRLRLPENANGEKLAMLSPAQVVSEMTALSDLAASHQVHLTGLDNPKVAGNNLYRRVLYHAQTKADFPALQAFVDAFRASNIRVGVLQASIRPSVSEGLVTAFDFVVYTTP